MNYSMKFAGILNETGPTLNENAFHSFMVAKQIFLWQLPQLHHAIGSYQSRCVGCLWYWVRVEVATSPSGDVAVVVVPLGVVGGVVFAWWG